MSYLQYVVIKDVSYLQYVVNNGKLFAVSKE